MAVVGDYVWWDENNDGIRNDGAGLGLNGVEVKAIHVRWSSSRHDSPPLTRKLPNLGSILSKNVSPWRSLRRVHCAARTLLGIWGAHCGDGQRCQFKRKVGCLHSGRRSRQQRCRTRGLEGHFPASENQVWWDQNEDGLQVDIETRHSRCDGTPSSEREHAGHANN